ncbi:DUF4128 domain-containing protein [Gammaproteobacteria bacterium]|nr:DUF4128 domain-containing protein [Gammaproteobacteria bacterium]
MAESDIQGALFVAAETFLAANGIATSAVAWPNRDFDPAGLALWAAVHYMPNDPVSVTAGSLGRDEETGLIQIDINVPRNTGDSVFRTFRNASRAYFIPGQTFTQNSQDTIIVSCGMSSIRVVDNWFRVSLSIIYRADFYRALIT